MAYRPSKRSHNNPEDNEPNITPMMNLMVVLIPLLLTSAEFVKLGVIELNLPPASQGPLGQENAALPIEEVKKLDLTVTVTDKGFFISSSLAVLSGETEGEPTIPMSGASGTLEYDFQALSAKLYGIKVEAANLFPDNANIIIQAEPNVDYQTVVSTMDASRFLYINGKIQELFPEVSLSAGVF